LTKYLREHVLEAAKNDARTRKRKEEIELDLDNGSVAPRLAASELWSSIITASSENNANTKTE